MATTLRRKPVRRWSQWLKPLSPDSLKMMVMSGVVRRADWAPPLFQAGPVYSHSGAALNAGSQDSEPEQGWLSRMLGRKARAHSPHRA